MSYNAGNKSELGSTLTGRREQKMNNKANEIKAKMVAKIAALSEDALAWLRSCELAGNVRELENLLQRALALSSGGMLLARDFSDHEDHTRPVPEAPSAPDTAETLAMTSGGDPAGIPDDLQRYLDDQERQVLLKALKESDFNRTAAAARLGLNLRQMRYRIQRLGITMPSSDDDDITH
jgi:two-component system response regulator PilR (NtrC family)